MKTTALLLLSFLSLARPLVAQNTGGITGMVLDKNSQQALEAVNIQVEGTSRGTSTDSAGYFHITNIPVGTYSVLFSSLGYKDYTLYNIVITSGNESNYTIEMEEEISTLSEIVVRGTTRTVKAATIETPLSVQKVTTEEIRSNPGGNFDISKVIQTLPGVGGGAGGGSFRNDIIIRGGAPNENVFYLDGIEVPVINHFQTQGSSGGPQGILNVSFIEEVKLASSAFDAKYDNAISSVFQFKQKNGNPNQFQGNTRLSATEFAATLEGPISKEKGSTFLVSARRSYLQFLFQAIDLPIRPNFWDFQAKLNYPLDANTTLTFIGMGAIDEFSFAAPKKSTPEKLYVINSNANINQWNYTTGVSLKRLLKKGYLNLALSRTAFDNDIVRFEDNRNPESSAQTLDLKSRETENKLRLDINKNLEKWKLAYGASIQTAAYINKTFAIQRKEIKDEDNVIVQPGVTANFESPLDPFMRIGAFIQAGKRFASDRLGISAGLRTDMNTFTTGAMDPFNTLSPRISLSYTLTDLWTLNASAGKYYKLAPYTILGFADNQNRLVNGDADYLGSTHLATGLEFIPAEDLRFTLEGFYKKYARVPVSVRSGISLSNLGRDFSVLGNEAVITNGKGKTYGIEFFAQKKLTERFFGILSYTWYYSQYSGVDGIFYPSSWDNRHLLSLTWGYKFKRNWELGLKFRYQGGAPFTPFDETASRLNYLSQGTGTLDYSMLNSQRLNAFNSSDIRINKKWNFKHTTLDLFVDVTNWYVARNPEIPEYTFRRNENNTAFLTTDGNSIKPDGSNAIPTRVKNDDPFFTPTIGFIVEF